MCGLLPPFLRYSAYSCLIKISSSSSTHVFPSNLILHRCEEVVLGLYSHYAVYSLLKPPTRTGPQPVILSTGEVNKR